MPLEGQFSRAVDNTSRVPLASHAATAPPTVKERRRNNRLCRAGSTPEWHGTEQHHIEPTSNRRLRMVFPAQAGVVSQPERPTVFVVQHHLWPECGTDLLSASAIARPAVPCERSPDGDRVTTTGRGTS